MNISKKYRPVLATVLLAVLFIFIGFILEKDFYHRPDAPDEISSFEEILHKKQRRIAALMEQELLAGRMPSHPFISGPDHFGFSEQGLFILDYYHDSLIYWSDNLVAFDKIFRESKYNNQLVRLPNGWYLVDVLSGEDRHIVGLIQIRKEFSYENRYLKEGFAKDFFLSPELGVSVESENAGIAIRDEDGKFLFALKGDDRSFYFRGETITSIISYLLGLVCLLISFTMAISLKESNFRFGIHFLLLFVVYAVIVAGLVPGVLFRLKLFSPAAFAVSDWLPSLGAFTILAILVLNWSVVFIRFFSLRNKELSKGKTFAVALFWGIIGIIFFESAFYLGHLAIQGSNLSLGFIEEFVFSPNNLLFTFDIAILILAALFVGIKSGIEIGQSLKQPQSYWVGLISAGVGWGIFSYFTGFSDYIVPVFFLVFLFLTLLIRREHFYAYRFSIIALFVMLLTIAGILFFTGKILERDRKVQQLIAENIASEHDPAAEVQLLEIESGMKNDPDLPMIVRGPFSSLNRYLSQTYFNGYLRNFDLQITLCAREDSVLVQPENEYFPCSDFFSEMLQNEGMKLPGEVFYFMDKRNARVSYLGEMIFPAIDGEPPIWLYMEISSRPVYEGLGFPELLMDEKLHRFKKLTNISYAKYSYGDLVDRHGSFNYNLNSHAYPIPDEEFSIGLWDGYDHYVYNMGEGNLVVVSKPHFGWIKLLMTFPFVFLFLFSLALILFFRFIFSGVFKRWSFGFRFKFQLAILGILLFTLVVVAAGVIWYNVYDHKKKSWEELQSVLNSVSVALERQLMPENVDNRRYVTDLLVEFSEVFWVDINLYDLSGGLIASSRPEIYDKGLLSMQMNTAAFLEMNFHSRSEFLHEEQIGLLRYFSAYMPIMDMDGEVLAYMNLPYFTRQDKLRKEIIGFIISFLNLYVLMVLISVFIAVLISNRITSPLLTIREKIRSVQFGKANEKIDYYREDEIGDLVKEYNKKVDELAGSAELLARSERESAWREMARQIAHEIKNPLTPMKLNLQYLQRAKSEKRPEYEEFFYRVTQTLIDQIDLLSSIASSFSDFANLSKMNLEKVNLVEILTEIYNLFHPTKGVEIFYHSTLDEVFVYGDREQLSRVFINLVKNGVQAVPEERAGKVVIDLKTEEDNAIVSVADNGMGIPKEVRKKLFFPNFTTKTRGMGLGLAIVKGIVESLDGEIWYSTSEGRGTTFFVKIPLVQGEEA